MSEPMILGPCYTVYLIHFLVEGLPSQLLTEQIILYFNVELSMVEN